MHQYFLSIRRFWPLGLAIASLLLVAGCGGGSDDDSANGSAEITVETSSLSKVEFIKRADAICQKGRDQFDREFEAFTTANKEELAEAENASEWVGGIVNGILLPNYEARIDELTALGAPEGDQKEVEVFLNAFQDRLNEMSEKPTELSRTVRPFKSVEKAARDYGLNGCVSSLS